MSLHLVKADALFMHIPKTGGVWVEEVLKRIGIEAEYAKPSEHVTWRHALLRDYPRRFSFVFTFVRHPVAWYESWWKFQAGFWTQFEPGVWHPQRILEKCQSDDFSEFIRLCIRYEPAYVSRMLEWYVGPEGDEFPDFVGSYHNLADDLVKVLRILSYDFDEDLLRRHPSENVSASLKGMPVWDESLRNAVIALEAPAIRRFFSKATTSD